MNCRLAFYSPEWESRIRSFTLDEAQKSFVALPSAVIDLSVQDIAVKDLPRDLQRFDSSFSERTAEVPVHRRNFNKDLHLYLCIGQSNMAGRAPIEEEDQGIIERVYLLNNNDQWEPAQTGEYGTQGHQGFNRFSTVEVASKKNGLSLALPFSKVIAERVPHAEIGIISNAVGDTSIAKWQKEAGTGLFEEAVRRTKAAMDYGQLKGILWHQGEADRYNDYYIEHLELFVTDLRSELGVGASEVPFIAGQLLPGSKYELFNTTLIVKISDKIANSAYVSSEGTGSIGDNTHFNSESQRILGKRYACKMLEMMC